MELINMPTYQSIYKCRLCGEEFEKGEVETESTMSVTSSLVINNSTGFVVKGKRLYRHASHNCKNGSYGFADFLGFRKKE